MASEPAPKERAEPKGIRALARAQMNAAIKRIAWEQLKEHGASELSLRAISREMDMTSSAIYRYFKNRDALLTALIIDAYDDIGARVEESDAAIPNDHYRQRFVSIGNTLIEWGEEDPHRFALVYGPPIPGYAAPDDTIGPGTRVQLTLYRLLGEWSQAHVEDLTFDLPPLPKTLDLALQSAAADVGVPVPSHQVAEAMAIWSELMGVIYSHFFNHFGNAVTHDGHVAQWLIERMALRLFPGAE